MKGKHIRAENVIFAIFHMSTFLVITTDVIYFFYLEHVSMYTLSSLYAPPL